MGEQSPFFVEEKMTKAEYEQLISDYFEYDEQDNIDKAQVYVEELEQKINNFEARTCENCKLLIGKSYTDYQAMYNKLLEKYIKSIEKRDELVDRHLLLLDKYNNLRIG